MFNKNKLNRSVNSFFLGTLFLVTIGFAPLQFTQDSGTLNNYFLNIEGDILGVQSAKDIEDLKIDGGQEKLGDATFYFVNNVGTSTIYKFNFSELDGDENTPVSATLVGSTGLPAGPDVSSPDEISSLLIYNDVLYGLSLASKKLYSISKVDGSVTLLATLSVPGDFRSDGMTMREGIVYLLKTNDTGGESEIWKFDLFPSGNISYVRQIETSGKVEALTAHPDGFLYASDETTLYQISVINSDIGYLADYTVDIEGMDYFYEWTGSNTQFPFNTIWAVNDDVDGSLQYYTLETTTTFPLAVSVVDGWNMVSIPGLHPTNQDVTTWWSNLTGSVFKFSGGYLPVTTAATGEGYWMKNAGAETYNYPAIDIVTHDPISATAGWNLIGGYENAVATSGLTTTPSGLISGSVYGYSGGYVTATNLVPGYGYWIKLTGAGLINIPPAPLSKGSGEIVEYFKDDWGKIIITDNAGRSYTLYAVKGEVDLDNFELPPMPPVGMIDIRYSSDRIAEDINSSIQSIEMSGLEYPISVRIENMSITLQDESGNQINRNMKSGEEITISNKSINKLMVSGSGEMIPNEYTLEQNYPNPFNPNTIIKFALPQDSKVNLIVFNILGEKVAKLINQEMKAGYHQIEFNASTLASGVYLYRIKAGDFVETKKMVLMK